MTFIPASKQPTLKETISFPLPPSPRLDNCLLEYQSDSLNRTERNESSVSVEPRATETASEMGEFRARSGLVPSSLGRAS